MNHLPDSAKSRPAKQIKRRLVIPMVFIVLVTGLLLWGIVRGTSTDLQPKNPSSATSDVVTQLLLTSAGQKRIRAAVIVGAPPERVWRLITDYDHFSDVFPNFKTSNGVLGTNGQWHVTSEVRSMVGRWPMDIHVRHEESATRFVASWDEPNGAWKINRGSWVVTPHGSNETLLEYNLELRVSPFPDFVVRAVLLEQLKPVMKAVKNRGERDGLSR